MSQPDPESSRNWALETIISAPKVRVTAYLTLLYMATHDLKVMGKQSAHIILRDAYSYPDEIYGFNFGRATTSLEAHGLIKRTGKASILYRLDLLEPPTEADRIFLADTLTASLKAAKLEPCVRAAEELIRQLEVDRPTQPASEPTTAEIDVAASTLGYGEALPLPDSRTLSDKLVAIQAKLDRVTPNFSGAREFNFNEAAREQGLDPRVAHFFLAGRIGLGKISYEKHPRPHWRVKSNKPVTPAVLDKLIQQGRAPYSWMYEQNPGSPDFIPRRLIEGSNHRVTGYYTAGGSVSRVELKLDEAAPSRPTPRLMPPRRPAAPYVQSESVPVVMPAVTSPGSLDDSLVDPESEAAPEPVVAVQPEATVAGVLEALPDSFPDAQTPILPEPAAAITVEDSPEEGFAEPALEQSFVQETENEKMLDLLIGKLRERKEQIETLEREKAELVSRLDESRLAIEDLEKRLSASEIHNQRLMQQLADFESKQLAVMNSRLRQAIEEL